MFRNEDGPLSFDCLDSLKEVDYLCIMLPYVLNFDLREHILVSVVLAVPDTPQVNVRAVNYAWIVRNCTGILLSKAHVATATPIACV